MKQSLMWLKRAVILASVFFIANSFAAVFPPAPNPFHYVNDYTQTLSQNHQQILENKLIAYGKETSSQIAVVIVPTTGEEEIADYTFKLGDKWGIGRKNLNNGVLMLIAKNDRKVFIATGPGLEGVLPDAFLSQIIRNAILPEFKQGNYAQGINAGLDYIIAASKGEFAPQLEDEIDLEDLIPILFVVIFLFFIFFNHSRRGGDVYISPSQVDRLLRQSTLSRRGGNGGGFGGFGGGGFGGGSSGGGFGGGSFGGGGAGGSW